MIKKHIKGILIAAVCIASFFTYVWMNRPDRPITLKLGVYAGGTFDVHNADSFSTIDEAIELFEKKHPNITIEYESGIVKSEYSSWVSKKILKDEQLDAFMVLNEDFNTLASIGALANLDGSIEATSSFYEGVLSTGKYNGHLYALPYEANTTVMCINRDLLEKENIPIPDASWTLDDFYEICNQVAKDTDDDGNIDQFALSNYTWQDAVNGYGVSLFDESGNTCYLTDATEALSFVEKLQDLNGGYSPTYDDFDSGVVAFCPMTIAQYRTYQPYPYRLSKYSSFSWFCLPMPGIEGNKKTVTCETSLIAVNARSSYQEYACEFIKLLTSTEIQKNIIHSSQGVSVLKEVMHLDEVKTLLENEGTMTLNIDLLDSILSNLNEEANFKNYHTVLEEADYLIKESLENDSIELDIYSIQQQLSDLLKQK